MPKPAWTTTRLPVRLGEVLRQRDGVALSGEIEVDVRPVQQEVADAAADEVEGEPPPRRQADG